MTHAREAGSFHAVIWRVGQALGWERAADAAGVTATRLYQLANPNRNDADVLDTLCNLDAACSLAGLGTPIFDAWWRRLDDAGTGVAPSSRIYAGSSPSRIYAGSSPEGAPRGGLEAAVRGAVSGLRAVLEMLEAALMPQPELKLARVR